MCISGSCNLQFPLQRSGIVAQPESIYGPGNHMLIIRKTDQGP